MTTFFLVDKTRGDPNTALSRPSSARQQNAIKMAFRWHADDGPTLDAAIMLAWQICDFQGIRTSIAKKPYIFVIFHVFLSLRVVLILVKSADPDEMQHNNAFYLELHYLPKYPY